MSSSYHQSYLPLRSNSPLMPPQDPLPSLNKPTGFTPDPKPYRAPEYDANDELARKYMEASMAQYLQDRVQKFDSTSLRDLGRSLDYPVRTKRRRMEDAQVPVHNRPIPPAQLPHRYRHVEETIKQEAGRYPSPRSQPMAYPRESPRSHPMQYPHDSPRPSHPPPHRQPSYTESPRGHVYSRFEVRHVEVPLAEPLHVAELESALRWESLLAAVTTATPLAVPTPQKLQPGHMRTTKEKKTRAKLPPQVLIRETLEYGPLTPPDSGGEAREDSREDSSELDVMSARKRRVPIETGRPGTTWILPTLEEVRSPTEKANRDRASRPLSTGGRALSHSKSASLPELPPELLATLSKGYSSSTNSAATHSLKTSQTSKAPILPPPFSPPTKPHVPTKRKDILPPPFSPVLSHSVPSSTPIRSGSQSVEQGNMARKAKASATPTPSRTMGPVKAMAGRVVFVQESAEDRTARVQDFDVCRVLDSQTLERQQTAAISYSISPLPSEYGHSIDSETGLNIFELQTKEQWQNFGTFIRHIDHIGRKHGVIKVKVKDVNWITKANLEPAEAAIELVDGHAPAVSDSDIPDIACTVKIEQTDDLACGIEAEEYEPQGEDAHDKREEANATQAEEQTSLDDFTNKPAEIDTEKEQASVQTREKSPGSKKRLSDEFDADVEISCAMKKKKAKTVKRRWGYKSKSSPPKIKCLQQTVSQVKSPTASILAYRIKSELKKQLASNAFQSSNTVFTDTFSPSSVTDFLKYHTESMPAQPPLYSSDNAATLTLRRAVSITTVALMSLSSNTIHSIEPVVPGIHTPFLYLGHTFTAFALHQEDYGAYSLNYSHSGASKKWIIINPADHSKLEDVVNDILEANGEPKGACSQFVRHSSLFIPPASLEEAHIGYTVVCQNPGEMIVTFPGAYHEGWNEGSNINEAVAYATTEWLENKGKGYKECVGGCTGGAPIIFRFVKQGEKDIYF